MSGTLFVSKSASAGQKLPTILMGQWAAEHYHRVKAVHSQVAALDARALNDSLKDQELDLEQAAARARGETGYPSPLAAMLAQLRGAPMRERLLDYAPGKRDGPARRYLTDAGLGRGLVSRGSVQE
jgi:hypothetical protein